MIWNVTLCVCVCVWGGGVVSDDMQDHNVFNLTLNMDALKPSKQQEQLTQYYSAKFQTTWILKCKNTQLDKGPMN